MSESITALMVDDPDAESDDKVRPAKMVRYRGRTSLVNYFLVVAKRIAIGSHRRRREQAADMEVLDPADRHAGPGDPDRERQFDRLADAIREAYRSLTARQRFLLAMIHGQGMPKAEAGELVGLPPWGVSRELDRIHDRMRGSPSRAWRPIRGEILHAKSGRRRGVGASARSRRRTPRRSGMEASDEPGVDEPCIDPRQGIRDAAGPREGSRIDSIDPELIALLTSGDLESLSEPERISIWEAAAEDPHVAALIADLAASGAVLRAPAAEARRTSRAGLRLAARRLRSDGGRSARMAHRRAAGIVGDARADRVHGWRRDA